MAGSGVFTLNVDTESGAVTSVQIEKSTGWGILDASCLKTFKQWRFKPHAVAKVHMPITFTTR
jgi:TonB family protein